MPSSKLKRTLNILYIYVYVEISLPTPLRLGVDWDHWCGVSFHIVAWWFISSNLFILFLVL